MFVKEVKRSWDTAVINCDNWERYGSNSRACQSCSTCVILQRLYNQNTCSIISHTSQGVTYLAVIPLTFHIHNSTRTWQWFWWHICAHLALVSCLSAHLCSWWDCEFFDAQSLLVALKQNGTCHRPTTGVHYFCLSAYRFWRLGCNPKPPDGRKFGFHSVGSDGKRQTVQD